MHDPYFNDEKNEVVGTKFHATQAFVSSRTQERQLRDAFILWRDLEILVVPDLYERLLYQRELPQTPLLKRDP